MVSSIPIVSYDIFYILENSLEISSIDDFAYKIPFNLYKPGIHAVSLRNKLNSV